MWSPVAWHLALERFLLGCTGRRGSALGWLVVYQDKLLAESFVIFQNWLAQGGAVSPPRDRFMKMSKHRNIQKINNLITTAQESSVG